MAKSNTGVQSVLEKVAEVTSSAATALQNELKRLAEERDQMVAHYDVAAEKIRQSLRSLGQHFGISHAPTGRRRRGRSRVATHSAVRGTRAHAGATAKKGKRIRRRYICSCGNARARGPRLSRRGLGECLGV